MGWILRFLQNNNHHTKEKYYGELRVYSTRKVVISCEEIKQEFLRSNHENLNDYFPQNIFLEIINSITKQKASFLGEEGRAFYLVVNNENEELISIYFSNSYLFDEFFRASDLLLDGEYLATKKPYLEVCQSLESTAEMISIKCKNIDLLGFQFFKILALCIAKITDGIINTDQMFLREGIKMWNYDSQNWEEEVIKKIIF